jgi:hypothetical protein
MTLTFPASAALAGSVTRPFRIAVLSIHCSGEFYHNPGLIEDVTGPKRPPLRQVLLQQSTIQLSSRHVSNDRRSGKFYHNPGLIEDATGPKRPPLRQVLLPQRCSRRRAPPHVPSVHRSGKFCYATSSKTRMGVRSRSQASTAQASSVT